MTELPGEGAAHPAPSRAVVQYVAMAARVADNDSWPAQTNSFANLWAEPGASPNQKDAVESRLVMRFTR
jgi:hypothetical protein